LILADGSEAAFAHKYQPIMDLVHDSFSQSFSQSAGSIQDRLLLATASIEQSMFERFPSSAQFGEKQYSASFIAVVVSGKQALCLWIGSGQAKVFRMNKCFYFTNPHVNIFYGKYGGPFGVRYRSLSTIPGQGSEQMDVLGPWPLQDEDILVISDHRLFMLINDEEIAGIIAETQDSPAKALVDRAQSIIESFAQCAIVARVIES
jgi:hypothetical protein